MGLLAPVLALVLISLTVLFSISSSLFWSQLFFLFISLVIFFLISHLNYKVLTLYAKPIYVTSIVVLLLVLILGIESRGAVRWVELFGFRIQFSEFMKPFLAVSFASFLSRNKNKSLKSFFYALGFLLPVAFLIFIQPDLGNALIYAIVVLFSLLAFGFPFKYFLVGFAFLLLTSPIVWRILHDYQRQRLLTFLNPTSDPLGHSYNAIQSVIAVGSGMLLGRGLGQGTQSVLKFLPERHTDFIFATSTEELGFIGALLILFIFGLLLYKIFLIFLKSNDSFSKIFALVAFFIILVQFFINVGMNIGIVPIVGVTLPFVSYGGSSLLSNFILLGFLSAVDMGENREKDVLEIR